MGGGDPENEEDWVGPLPPSLAEVRLAEAPVLFFVYSHKAFRSELASLRRTAAEHVGSWPYSRDIVVDLSRRLEFLKLVYNYHSAAEDEVIFLALDAKVKNVVPTYSLEHKSIDDKFSSIFYLLDLLMSKDEDAPPISQEIIFSIGTVETIICQHMQKEEEQVFPLVVEKFNFEEQSQLVWQYMSSVPIILLEDFFPWMNFYLTSDEKIDVLECINLIIPKERALQEVVVSWFQHNERPSSDAYGIYGKGYRFFNGISSSEDIVNLYPPQQQKPETCSGHQLDFEGPFKEIFHWHAALRRSLDQIIEELYEIRSSNCVESLSLILLQLKFIADVLIFYSNYLDKVSYPFINHLAENGLPPCSQLIEEVHIKGLQSLLFYENQGPIQVRIFAEMLRDELESLIRGFDKSLVFLETEVLPFFMKTCTDEMQLWLLYTGLRMMPLGLLRCTITWFSTQVHENQLNSILKNVEEGCPAISQIFTSLLYEWVRIASSGKTSVAKFRQNLEELFGRRSFYLANPFKKHANFQADIMKTVSVPSSSGSSTSNQELDMTYPCGTNLHIFFSMMFNRIPHVQKNHAESSGSVSLSLEKRPMDLIIYIHRALVKDLEYLVSLSMKLVASFGCLAEFMKHFNVFHSMYQIHSNSEDEIAFPALESKGALQNISVSYCIDHKLEVKLFGRTSRILDEISKFHDEEGSVETKLKRHELCLKLHDACLSLHKVLSDHISREEVEIFPSFRGCFSIDEEKKIVGHMLGRVRAEVLQEMIPWLMAYLTPDEQQSAMSLWRSVARNTKFDEWLGEWWEGIARYHVNTIEEGSRPSPLLAIDPLEIVSKYVMKDTTHMQNEMPFVCMEPDDADKATRSSGEQDGLKPQEDHREIEKKKCNETNNRCHDDETGKCGNESQKLSHQVHPLCMSQDELEAAIRRVSRDSSLDSEKKSHIIQSLLMSRWIIKQKLSDQETATTSDKEEIPGQYPAYRDNLKTTFGCKHYTRNCKLLAPCCNKLYTCIRCHDDLTDHSVDRKSITKMMCMQCLVVQPIGPKCISPSCNGFSMGKYYCRICRLFDDERQIYHCPYCNLCRVGKGLGIDYFHCMICNACMSRSLLIHVCREKCLEDNCPICHEYIFTSNSPVKALPCGHLMHSACFHDYTCSHYICPICSKSLGDMQVYFGMLDALLAEEKVPEEYSGQMQVILCNDCEKRGNAAFHWLYHKCSYCGSYNTRLL